jgi:hypothetical protein
MWCLPLLFLALPLLLKEEGVRQSIIQNTLHNNNMKVFKTDVNALNARLPRHFADVVQRHDATRWGQKPSYSRSESSPLGRRGWERKPTVFFPKRKSFNFFDMKGGFSRGDEGEEKRNTSSPVPP